MTEQWIDQTTIYYDRTHCKLRKTKTSTRWAMKSKLNTCVAAVVVMSEVFTIDF